MQLPIICQNYLYFYFFPTLIYVFKVLELGNHGLIWIFEIHIRIHMKELLIFFLGYVLDLSIHFKKSCILSFEHGHINNPQIGFSLKYFKSTWAIFGQ
jgi:hypothetical protein